MADAKEIAKKLTKREIKAMRYYALSDISPRAPSKITHPDKEGWSSGTIDSLLEKRLLVVGPDGWYVHSHLGIAVARELENTNV
jgi:hypothetical protein